MADELTSDLDVTVQTEIVSPLEALRRNRRLGIPKVNHDRPMAAGFADHVIVMKDG